MNESPYCSIVGPKLEYASASWDPHYEKDVHTLERVRRKAARFCLQNFKRTASVTDMLGELEWDTLEMRRKKNRLTVMCKLSRSLVGIKTDRKTSYRIARPEHIGAMRLRIRKIHRKNVFKFSFFPRSICEWNSLPSEIVNS